MEASIRIVRKWGGDSFNGTTHFPGKTSLRSSTSCGRTNVCNGSDRHEHQRIGWDILGWQTWFPVSAALLVSRLGTSYGLCIMRSTLFQNYALCMMFVRAVSCTAHFFNKEFLMEQKNGISCALVPRFQFHMDGQQDPNEKVTSDCMPSFIL